MSAQLLGMLITVGIMGLIEPRTGFAWLLIIGLLEYFK